MSNPRNITISMDHGGQADLLTEVVRAFLHTGTPSAFLIRVLEGVRKYREETDALAQFSDNRINAHLQYSLETLRNELRKMEDNEYALSQVEF